MVSYAVNHGDAMPSNHGKISDMPQSGHDGITVRRTGKSPLRFKGRKIIEATGHSTQGHMWHEINVWSRSTTGEFVVDLRIFKKGQGEKDIFRAERCSSMAEVVAWLESYDPRQDIRIDVNPDDHEITTAELVIKAVALRHRLEESVHLYNNLIGDLLFQLDLTDESFD